MGTAAIQLAKHLGLHVTTTVSSGKIKFVQDLGADRIIDRKTQDFAEEVRNMDGVLDSIDMDNLLRSFQCVKPGGTVVSISDGPDVALAQRLQLNRLLWPVFTAMSAKPNAAARRAGAKYRYLFVRADGLQLEGLNPLFEDGAMWTAFFRLSRRHRPSPTPRKATPEAKWSSKCSPFDLAVEPR